MQTLLQQLVNSTTIGAEYALIALGYTMVFGILRLINFAHGDVYMIGAFAGAYTAQEMNRAVGLTPEAEQSLGQFALVMLVALIICAMLGYAIERLAYRPLRNQSRLSALITAIGVSLLLENLVQLPLPMGPWACVALMAGILGVTTAMVSEAFVQRTMSRALRIGIAACVIATSVGIEFTFSVSNIFGGRTYFGPDEVTFPQLRAIPPFNTEAHKPIASIYQATGISVVPRDLLELATCLAAMGILYVILKHTRMGKAMRAVSTNYDAARLMGIDLNRVISFTFVLGSVLAGIGACFYGIRATKVRYDIGMMLGLKAFIAAVVGGIGNIPGAAAGGFLLGFVETLVSSVHVGETSLAPYRDAFSFLLLIIVLLVRPEGIFGRATPEKV